MSETENQTSSGQAKLMHYGMIACCAVMLLPFARFFLSGGTIAGLWSNTGVLAPIVLCLGAHLLMFKAVGKSRHCSPKKVRLAPARSICVRRRPSSPWTLKGSDQVGKRLHRHAQQRIGPGLLTDR